MSRKKRRKKEKSRKKVAYGVITVAFIIIFLVYFSLNQSNPTSQPKAAIVDHLSRREPNQTFVQESRTILEKRFSVNYYDWTKIDVGFFKNFFSDGYSLIVLRVHSAITMISGEEVVGLFTWEHYDPENVPAKYYQDVMDDRLVEAYFSEEERAKGETYFGITHKFIEKYGEFQNTVIIMMGCNGLTYPSMAEAFVKKGAKVYIGWNGLVSTSHTDRATARLLQHLFQGNTVKKAVEKTMNEVGPEEMYFQDQGYNSTLKYCPGAAGSYIIQYVLSISSMDTARANTVLAKEEKEEKKGTRLIWLY